MKQLSFITLVTLVYLVCVNAESCVQCNSATDPKCATDPQQFLSKECNNSTSKCYTRVLNGNTIRGCASDLDNTTATNCNNELECLICSFVEGCNRNIFPTHRARCLQCSGNATSACAANIYASPQICPIYKLGDQCFIRKDVRNSTESFQRGCLSSVVLNNLCVDAKNCYSCEGVGCNYLRANDTTIPLAHDGAAFMATSLALILFSIIATRFN